MGPLVLNSKLKTDPELGFDDSNVIFPSKLSQIRLQMKRPRPMPLVFISDFCLSFPNI
jgi:hypothetical protein